VTEAIEKAVESMIIEGVKEKLWALQNPKDSTSVAFTNYRDEKKLNYSTDPLGRKIDKDNRGVLTLGINAGSNMYSGDFSKSLLRPKTSLTIGAAFNPYLNFDVEMGWRGLMVQQKVDDKSYFGDMALRYVFLPFEKLTPYATAGIGVDNNSPLGYRKYIGLSEKEFLPKLNSTFGLEYMVNNKMGISLSAGVNYYLTDTFDGSTAGKYNDYSWGVSLGWKFYFIKTKQK
jgi:curli production assembly/transport component CsgG